MTRWGWGCATQGTLTPPYSAGGDAPHLPDPPARRYVRLQQNGSGVVGIDSFTTLGTTTFYNDINQLITSWDVFANIG